MDNESKEDNHSVESKNMEPIVEDAVRRSDLDTKLFDTVEAEVIFKQDEKMEELQKLSEQSVRAEAILVELNEVTQRFKHHTPTQQQIVLMEDLAKTYAYLAKMILALCPRCADRTHAMRQLQDSKMWANTAIMLEGKI